MRWNIDNIEPSDPSDVSPSLLCTSDKEYGHIKYGDTFYVVRPPFYVVTPKGKVTKKLQKFKLAKI